MKMSAEYHTRRWYEEKKRLKRGKVDGYRGKSLIICLPTTFSLFHNIRVVRMKGNEQCGRKEEQIGWMAWLRW